MGPALRLALVCRLALPSRGANSAFDVLSLLYRSTNGDHWHNNQGWLTGDPCDGTWMTSSKHDCYSGELTDTYQPICCELVSLADTKPRVTKLDLSNNNLEGTLPSELVRSCLPRVVTFATHLFLPGLVWQADLTTLKVLALDGNRLSGTIPASFGSLWNLHVLWLQHNFLSGSIPQEVCPPEARALGMHSRDAWAAGRI